MPDEWDVVSPLSFVIDKLELCAVINGARRSRVLPSTDELVNVRSGLELDVIVPNSGSRIVSQACLVVRARLLTYVKPFSGYTSFSVLFQSTLLQHSSSQCECGAVARSRCVDSTVQEFDADIRSSVFNSRTDKAIDN